MPEVDIFLVSKSRNAYLGKYERPRESSRVSESVNDRMVNSAVGWRSSSNEDDYSRIRHVVVQRDST